MGRCADTQFETLTEFFNSRPKRGEQRRLTGLQGILVTFAGLGKKPTICVSNFNFTLPQTHLGGHDHSILYNSWLCKLEVVSDCLYTTHVVRSHQSTHHMQTINSSESCSIGTTNMAHGLCRAW